MPVCELNGGRKGSTLSRLILWIRTLCSASISFDASGFHTRISDVTTSFVLACSACVVPFLRSFRLDPATDHIAYAELEQHKDQWHSDLFDQRWYSHGYRLQLDDHASAVLLGYGRYTGGRPQLVVEHTQ